MPIAIPHPLTIEEIRVLQDFRRVSTETLSAEAIRKIKHPTGGGEAPILSLVAKGYLTADPAGESYTLTQKSKEFLAIDYKPIEEPPRKPTE